MSDAARIAFAVGTGRCGTYMAYELLRRDPAIAASHERNVLAECFHRYCTWYGLPVDEEAFVGTKRAEIEADLRDHRLSFEASAPLSFSVPTLHRAFGAKFILFVRNPVDVINSYLSKDWFVEDIHWREHDRAPGFHPGHAEPHHSFGRLMPMGAQYPDWSRLGRIGKLAWTWATVNRGVAAAFARLPPGQSMVIRLEDFDFVAYQRMMDFLACEPRLDRPGFEQITGSRPNARRNKPTLAQWTARDAEECLAQAAAAAREFGYTLDLSGAGQPGPGRDPAQRSGGERANLWSRLRRSVGSAARGFRHEWQKTQT